MKSLSLKLFLATMAMTVTSQVFAASELVTNGSFENPGNTSITAPQHFIQYTGNALPGWTIAGNVDVVDENLPNTVYRWQDAEVAGKQSLDLNGNQAGTISQVLSTVANVDYYLTFSYSKNPYGGAAVKTAQVLLDSNLFANITASAPSTPNNMNWTSVTYIFTALSNSTTLSFKSTSSGSNGVTLDAISVSAVPEPTTLALLGFGGIAAGIAGFRRRRAQKVAAV